MSDELDTTRRALEAAHASAMTVHDSPVRADQVYARIKEILDALPAVALAEERTARVKSALESAMRVLRRDEDGREAARHLQAALRFFESKPRSPSPFLDD